jgi:hypothetical protein
MSPWTTVLGDSLADLHPRLRAYFGAIPPGSRGVGAGTFDVAGTPRRWLWPVLWLFRREGIVFPAWQTGVPFLVVNQAVRDRVDGAVAVASVRTFNFRSGDRRMLDEIIAGPGGLVDVLGATRRLQARLEARVAGGELHLRSTGLVVRIGRSHIRIPNTIAPVVTLVERFDEASDRQRVAVMIDAPLLGRLYEYSGSFTFEVRPDHQHPK